MESILADNYAISPEEELILYEEICEVILEFLHIILDTLELAVLFF
jgi:hypothetical protein